MANSCPFCAIPANRFVHRTGNAVAIRDAYPVFASHALIVSVRHVCFLFDTTAEEQAD